MEELFEIIFELIFEGAFDVATSESRRVPLPLRVICAVISVALFGGVAVLIIFCGVVCVTSEDGKIVGALMFIFAAVYIVMMTRKVVKFLRNRG